jgi:phosphoglycerate dehydrogenase-like enzyme
VDDLVAALHRREDRVPFPLDRRAERMGRGLQAGGDEGRKRNPDAERDDAQIESRNMKKRYCIIGLGNFGFHVVNTLYQEGLEVVAIDMDREKIQRVQDCCSFASVPLTAAVISGFRCRTMNRP